LKFQQSFNTVWKEKWKYLEDIKCEANGNLPSGIWETGRILYKESAKSPQEGKTSRKIRRERSREYTVMQQYKFVQCKL